MPAGGFNRVDFFRLKTVGSAYAIKQIDGVTAATTAAHAAFKSDKNTKISHGRKGKTYGLTIEQTKVGAELEALIEAIILAPATSSSGIVVSQEVYVNGDTEFGDASSSTGELLLAIGYSFNKAGEIFIYGTIGTLSDDTGSFDEVANTAAKPKFTFVGVKGEYAIDIIGLIDNAIVADPASFEIAAGRGYVTAMATAA